jgi:hypothetical protein
MEGGIKDRIMSAVVRYELRRSKQPWILKNDPVYDDIDRVLKLFKRNYRIYSNWKKKGYLKWN